MTVPTLSESTTEQAGKQDPKQATMVIDSLQHEHLKQQLKDVAANKTAMQILLSDQLKKNRVAALSTLALLPKTTQSLDLRYCGMQYLSKNELITIFKGIKHLDQLKSILLHGELLAAKFTTKELDEIFSVLPDFNYHQCVGSFAEFDENTLDKSAEELQKHFETLLPTIHTVNIRLWHISQTQKLAILPLLAKLPKTVTSIELDLDNIDQLTTEQLKEAFSNLPKNIRSLYILNSFLHYRGVTDLKIIFAALSHLENLNDLELDWEQFVKKASEQPDYDDEQEAAAPDNEPNEIKLTEKLCKKKQLDEIFSLLPEQAYETALEEISQSQNQLNKKNTRFNHPEQGCEFFLPTYQSPSPAKTTPNISEPEQIENQKPKTNSTQNEQKKPYNYKQMMLNLTALFALSASITSAAMTYQSNELYLNILLSFITLICTAYLASQTCASPSKSIMQPK